MKPSTCSCGPNFWPQGGGQGKSFSGQSSAPDLAGELEMLPKPTLAGGKGSVAPAIGPSGIRRQNSVVPLLYFGNSHTGVYGGNLRVEF